MANKEAIAKAPVSRVRRTPVGRRNVLTVDGKEPGFHYHVVNDTGGRIAQFQEAGYEIVASKDVRIGDKRIGKASADGSLAVVDVGQNQKAYVMRIPDEYYEEDQAAKQAHVNDTETAMREKALDGTYGKLEISRS